MSSTVQKYVKYLKEKENQNKNEWLRVVASYLEFGGLKNFRRVSKACREVSLPFWRKKAVLVLAQVKTGKAMLLSEFEERWALSQDVNNNEDFLQWATMPFINIKLVKWTMCVNKEEDTKCTPGFWDMAGPHLQSLKLQDCVMEPTVCGVRQKFRKLTETEQFVRYHALERIILPDEKHEVFLLPKLKELSLVGCSFQTGIGNCQCKGRLACWDCNRQRFMPIQRQNPTLKRLEMIDSDSSKVPIRPGFLDKILGRLPKLEEISGLPTGEPRLNIMRFLKTLRLNLNMVPMSSFVLTGEGQGEFLKSVENLEVFYLPSDHAAVSSTSAVSLSSLIPSKLESLKRFKIFGGQLVKDFNFLNVTGNLEELRINLIAYEKLDDKEFKKILGEDHFLPPRENMVERSDSGLLKKVQLMKLSRFEIDFEFTKENILQLKQWMPNIQVLKTILSDETFAVVCQQWADKLRWLNLLYESDVTDQGVVGRGKRKGIANLKELQTFELDAFCGKSKIGDASVSNGFLKAPRLLNLRICVSPTMSEESVKELQNKIPNVRIIRNPDPDGLVLRLKPHSGYDCCRRQEFLRRTQESTQKDVTKPQQGHNLRSRQQFVDSTQEVTRPAHGYNLRSGKNN